MKVTFNISFAEWIYISKCILGTFICYWLFVSFPKYPFHWSIISCLLVFSRENDSELALNRIKSNFLGSFVGLMVYLLPLPGVAIFCMGVAFTILLGFILKIEPTIRSALAAVIIVIINEDEADAAWVVGLERAGCVLLGCIIALVIGSFYRNVNKYFFRKDL